MSYIRSPWLRTCAKVVHLYSEYTVQPEIFARNLILRFAIENISQNLNLANNYSLNSL